MLDRFGIGARGIRRDTTRPRERPTAGVLHAELHGAAPTPAVWARAALARGHEQRAQAGEAVGVDDAERNEFRERLLELRRQQAGRADQFIEERGAVAADRVRDHLRARGQRNFLNEGAPVPVLGIAPREQCDRRAAHRCGAALAVRAITIARRQPPPSDAAGEAAVVEPLGLVAGKPRGQDFALPGRGGRGEALELLHQRLDRLGAFHAGVIRHALPREQETQEVARGDRLDLGAQALEGIAMNAREQAALAPLIRIDGQEPAAEREAFHFERRERRRDLARGQSKQIGERGLRDRPLAFQSSAHQLDQRLFARPDFLGMAGRRGDGGIEPRVGPERLRLRQALGRDPESHVRRLQSRDATVARERGDPVAPAGAGPRFRLAQYAEPQQCVVQFVGVGGVGPGFLLDARDRFGIEPAQFGRVFRREPAPIHHCLGTAFFQRRVIEIGIRPRREHFERERRRLGEIARDHADVASLEAGEQTFESADVHRLGQTIGDGLAHQRVIGDFPLADQILRAGELVGEGGADQILGVHARELRRHLTAAAEARQRERDARDPAPARDEHGRVEHRLDQDFAHARGIEIARHLGQLEAVRGGEREHDVVFGRRGLELEVELAAEALAQRKTPGAVDATAVRRMDDELHATDRIEEALEHDGIEGRQTAERRVAGGEIIDELRGGRGRQPDLGFEPSARGLAGGIVAEARGDFLAQARY